MVSAVGIICRPSQVVSVSVFPVVPSCPVVVISQGRPSALISLTLLALLVSYAYFPSKYHRFFSPSKLRIMCWHSLTDFNHKLHCYATFIITGSTSFISGVLGRFLIGQDSSIQCECPFCDFSHHQLCHEQHKAKAVLLEHCIYSRVWSDKLFGGGTDACFVFGFGTAMAYDTVPALQSSVPRELRHFLCPKTGGFDLDLVPTGKVPDCRDVAPDWCQLWHKGALLPQGLF